MTHRARGVLDTSIVAAFSLFDPAELPVESAITAVTLGELSRGPYATDDPGRRARRIAVLQNAEATFGDTLPYDSEAARLFGLICAAVYAIGRQPRRRTAELMIAATAARHGLPLYTTNPNDFAGIEDHVTIVPVTRPEGATG
ncbi:type II toxin-antitoxin system VapC family toxin [Nocardia otitidiscaviarum]|uniref:type II toxin-antitoxin system VapC family toxin n=1 Tax=Nocardia otitidiscaviarum TaxID=1823 RepID=UPI0018953474|nr:type II toxin-antitoxin system VapC family toxin [Nocardia otitidiscaviarum]MBF6239023.1 type II toxin-antitoxin system VapC family toxin [Nocardia otitidiscaviarum]